MGSDQQTYKANPLNTTLETPIHHGCFKNYAIPALVCIRYLYFALYICMAYRAGGYEKYVPFKKKINSWLCKGCNLVLKSMGPRIGLTFIKDKVSLTFFSYLYGSSLSSGL